MLLVSVVFSHSEGKHRAHDKERMFASRVLDEFARLIIQEKMDGVCKELKGREGKRGEAELLSMVSIVR
jgi:nucleolar pre-ribosomal-associated protein 1